ncbi:FAD-dependent monooxygenase [Terriglobus albidus]|uniref:FAD-dependent monooxygenase n=1 Tax=Terriglobus albidus TaxID=1592106 RepID=UPI0021DF7D4E|nr:FAD-dependent monooxygenase [Terriglobus albidus]
MSALNHGEIPVLIVGAGPTGLVLALWLTRLGVPVRIIDKVSESGTTSRALAVQVRTLEFYRQIGLAEEVIEGGRRVDTISFWSGGRQRGRSAAFGDMGKGLTPFPYVLIFPQDEHEKLLIRRLASLGVDVERQTELLGLQQVDKHILARLKRPDGSEESCQAVYVAGCDGARSKVREELGIGFPGGTYEHLFYVADVDAGGAAINGQLHVALDTADFLIVFPLKDDGRARLVGAVRREPEQADEKLSWDDVSKDVVNWMRIDVKRVNWFSTYHVHHRVSQQFRKGRSFLLGDAAHIHSPVGGQGMNTGIGDAVNLAWKLAAVLNGCASEAILDSYEPERIDFARRLVATTDRAFSLVTSRGRIARQIRRNIAPFVIPSFFEIGSFRRLMFRTVSQTVIHYRQSPMSTGKAGEIRSGDRLPWIANAFGTEDNFKFLTTLQWQVHVYGEPSPELSTVCRSRDLALHAIPWRAEMERAGLKRNALYLVRPDGHIGLADPIGNPANLRAYLDRWNIKPSA